MERMTVDMTSMQVCDILTKDETKKDQGERKAFQVCLRLYFWGNQTRDPDFEWGGMGLLMDLDEMNIYDDAIFKMFEEIGEDYEKMALLVRKKKNESEQRTLSVLVP